MGDQMRAAWEWGWLDGLHSRGSADGAVPTPLSLQDSARFPMDCSKVPPGWDALAILPSDAAAASTGDPIAATGAATAAPGDAKSTPSHKEGSSCMLDERVSAPTTAARSAAG